MAIVERIEAVTPDARRRLRLSNPATLTPLGEVEVATPGDVRAAVERARKAQPAWAALSFAERGRYLERAARQLAARQDEFVAEIVAETGKPRAGGADHRGHHGLRRAAVLREARRSASSPIAACRCTC